MLNWARSSFRRSKKQEDSNVENEPTKDKKEKKKKVSSLFTPACTKGGTIEDPYRKSSSNSPSQIEDKPKKKSRNPLKKLNSRRNSHQSVCSVASNATDDPNVTKHEDKHQEKIQQEPIEQLPPAVGRDHELPYADCDESAILETDEATEAVKIEPNEGLKSSRPTEKNVGLFQERNQVSGCHKIAEKDNEKSSCEGAKEQSAALKESMSVIHDQHRTFVTNTSQLSSIINEIENQIVTDNIKNENETRESFSTSGGKEDSKKVPVPTNADEIRAEHLAGTTTNTEKATICESEEKEETKDSCLREEDITNEKKRAHEEGDSGIEERGAQGLDPSVTPADQCYQRTVNVETPSGQQEVKGNTVEKSQFDPLEPQSTEDNTKTLNDEPKLPIKLNCGESDCGVETPAIENKADPINKSEHETKEDSVHSKSNHEPYLYDGKVEVVEEPCIKKYFAPLTPASNGKTFSENDTFDNKESCIKPINAEENKVINSSSNLVQTIHVNDKYSKGSNGSVIDSDNFSEDCPNTDKINLLPSSENLIITEENNCSELDCQPTENILIQNNISLNQQFEADIDCELAEFENALENFKNCSGTLGVDYTDSVEVTKEPNVKKYSESLTPEDQESETPNSEINQFSSSMSVFRVLKNIKEVSEGPTHDRPPIPGKPQSLVKPHVPEKPASLSKAYNKTDSRECSCDKGLNDMNPSCYSCFKNCRNKEKSVHFRSPPAITVLRPQDCYTIPEEISSPIKKKNRTPSPGRREHSSSPTRKDHKSSSPSRRDSRHSSTTTFKDTSKSTSPTRREFKSPALVMKESKSSGSPTGRDAPVSFTSFEYKQSYSSPTKMTSQLVTSKILTREQKRTALLQSAAVMRATLAQEEEFDAIDIDEKNDNQTNNIKSLNNRKECSVGNIPEVTELKIIESETVENVDENPICKDTKIYSNNSNDGFEKHNDLPNDNILGSHKDDHKTNGITTESSEDSDDNIPLCETEKGESIHLKSPETTIATTNSCESLNSLLSSGSHNIPQYDSTEEKSPNIKIEDVKSDTDHFNVTKTTFCGLPSEETVSSTAGPKIVVTEATGKSSQETRDSFTNGGGEPIPPVKITVTAATPVKTCANRQATAARELFREEDPVKQLPAREHDDAGALEGDGLDRGETDNGLNSSERNEEQANDGVKRIDDRNSNEDKSKKENVIETNIENTNDGDSKNKKEHDDKEDGEEEEEQEEVITIELQRETSMKNKINVCISRDKSKESEAKENTDECVMRKNKNGGYVGSITKQIERLSQKLDDETDDNNRKEEKTVTTANSYQQNKEVKLKDDTRNAVGNNTADEIINHEDIINGNVTKDSKDKIYPSLKGINNGEARISQSENNYKGRGFSNGSSNSITSVGNGHGPAKTSSPVASVAPMVVTPTTQSYETPCKELLSASLVSNTTVTPKKNTSLNPFDDSDGETFEESDEDPITVIHSTPKTTCKSSQTSPKSQADAKCQSTNPFDDCDDELDTESNWSMADSSRSCAKPPVPSPLPRTSLKTSISMPPAPFPRMPRQNKSGALSTSSQSINTLNSSYSSYNGSMQSPLNVSTMSTKSLNPFDESEEETDVSGLERGTSSGRQSLKSGPPHSTSAHDLSRTTAIRSSLPNRRRKKRPAPQPPGMQGPRPSPAHATVPPSNPFEGDSLQSSSSSSSLLAPPRRHTMTGTTTPRKTPPPRPPPPSPLVSKLTSSSFRSNSSSAPPPADPWRMC